jgi:hypothetical protein
LTKNCTYYADKNLTDASLEFVTTLIFPPELILFNKKSMILLISTLQKYRWLVRKYNKPHPLIQRYLNP